MAPVEDLISTLKRLYFYKMNLLNEARCTHENLLGEEDLALTMQLVDYLQEHPSKYVTLHLQSKYKPSLLIEHAILLPC